MMVAELSPPMSVENIQLKLKQKINSKGRNIRGCSLLPDGRMVLSCCNANTVNFINKDGVEIFQIGKDKTGSCAIDTVYIKDHLDLLLLFFRQRSSHKPLIQQLLLQTFE
jgi:hypothetical protein